MVAVKIFVTYCGGWGYRPKYERLKDQLKAKLPEVDLEFDSYGTPQTTGYMEVEVNGTLVHSKKNGDGYIDSDAKLQKIINAINEACGK